MEDAANAAQPPLNPARVVELRDDFSDFWRRLRSERADHKVTPSQLQALGHLRRHGHMSAARLAQYEQVTPQSIARTIAILETEGLVTRSPDPSDARAQLVAITDDGLQLLAEDGERRTGLLSALLHTHCTAHEREILFLAGRIMRQLAEAPAIGPGTSAHTTPGTGARTARGDGAGERAT